MFRYFLTAFVAPLSVLFLMQGTAYAGGGSGTIVRANGTMIVIKKSRRHKNRSYVYRLDKNGKQLGGCVREEQAAHQLRRAYMRAKSKWRAGYIPPNLRCQW